MVKRLRRRFILINMTILMLVMCTILTCIYVMMYRSERKELEEIVQQALAASWSDGMPVSAKYSGRGLVYITLYEAEHEAEIAYSITAAEQDAEMALAAWEIRGQGVQSGDRVIGGTDYYFSTRQTDKGVRLVLADCTIEENTMRQLRKNFLIIGAAGLVGLLLISIFLTQWEVKPIVAAWDAQKHFVSDASHELKTPLTVIATNTDLVLANPDSTIREQQKWLDYMKGETDRMSQLVKNLLFIAKADANEIKAVRTEMNLSSFLEELCMEYEIAVFESGRVLAYQIAPDIILELDKEKISRVIDILLDNAVKYSNAGTEISVRLFRE